MKELNRRQFFNLLVTGAAAFVGVTTASAAKRTFTAVHDDTSASPPPGSIHDNTESTSISPNVESDGDLMLAQYGSVRRSCRRTARRTARRTSRRQDRLHD